MPTLGWVTSSAEGSGRTLTGIFFPQHLYTLQSDRRNKSSKHLSLCVVITMLLTLRGWHFVKVFFFFFPALLAHYFECSQNISIVCEVAVVYRPILLGLVFSPWGMTTSMTGGEISQGSHSISHSPWTWSPPSWAAGTRSLKISSFSTFWGGGILCLSGP